MPTATVSDLFETGTGAATAALHAAERASSLGDEVGTCRAADSARASGGLAIKEEIILVEALRKVGRSDLAQPLAEQVASRIEAVATAHCDHAEILAMAAQCYDWLGHDDHATERYARAAIACDPTKERPALILADLFIRRGDPDAALAVWLSLVEANPKDGWLRLTGAIHLGHFGHRAQAETLLALAEPLCRDIPQIFAHVAAGIRGHGTGLDQHRYVAELFDRYSSGYDASLSKLNNSGPEMVTTLLEEMALPQKPTLAVLDAGCGTGLCAARLRPYAKLLHGADLSVGMLQQAKRKNLYDLLTRTDLSVLPTYPEGVFDMVVCADVLVYFGDLVPVLRNLATRLRPGGWVVLTLEDAGERAPEQGYLRLVSGRHAHRGDYLARALTAAGFNRPRHELRQTLRTELGRPVQGLAVAAQRLALF